MTITLLVLVLLGFVWLWQRQSRMAGKIAALEFELARLAQQARTDLPPDALGDGVSEAAAACIPSHEVALGVAATDPIVVAPASVQGPSSHASLPISEPPEDSRDGSFFELVKRNLFASAGIALLVLGFAFLLSAISWGDLLSPSTRIALAWGGAGLLAYLGARFSHANPLWGHISQGGAAGIAYLATYVGNQSYQLFSEVPALVIFSGISLALVIRAFQGNSKVLAGVGFLGAYAAPLLALQVHQDLLFNLLFGLLVTSYALWVSWRRRWLEIAVHAHFCAAGLAAASYASQSMALTPILQQGLLHAYLALFGVWLIAWTQADELQERESQVLAVCLSVVSLTYLALQNWLLADLSFSAAALVLASGLGALAHWHLRPLVLKEAAWVLSATSVVLANFGSGLSQLMVGIGVLAEGAVLMLATSSASLVRRWLARSLLVLGCLMLAFEGTWGLFLIVVATFVLGLATASQRSVVDQWLLPILTAVGLVLLPRHLEFMPAALYLVALMASAGVLASVAAWMGHLQLPLVRVPAVLASLSWIGVLISPSAHWGGVQLLALALPLIGLFAVLHTTAATRHVLFPYAAACLGVLLLQLPAMSALKLWHSGFLVTALISLGLSSHAWIQLSGQYRKLTGFSVEPGPPLAYGLSSAAGLLGMIPLLQLNQTPVWLSLLLPVSVAAAYLAWWRAGGSAIRNGGRVLALVAGALTVYVWGYYVYWDIYQAQDYLPWGVVLRTPLTPVVLSAVGVYCLFRSAREGQRADWMAAAAVCAVATLKLLSLVGGALFSPLGAALGLLAMGALFLLAGYWAPLPPAQKVAAEVGEGGCHGA